VVNNVPLTAAGTERKAGLAMAPKLASPRCSERVPSCFSGSPRRARWEWAVQGHPRQTGLGIRTVEGARLTEPQTPSDL